MSRKLSNVTANMIWIGLVVIIIAIITAALVYFQPWKLSATEDKKPGIIKRDANTIAIAGKHEPAGLNPYSCDAYSTALLARILYSGLVDFDEKGNAVADLAEEIPTVANGGITTDGKTVTFKLRQGVFWSDGQAFGAKDIVATWKYIMTDKRVSRHTGYSDIISIDAIDNNVKLKFKQYYPEYLTLFPVVLPAHVLAANPDRLEREPVGTGAYKLKEWLLGDCLLLTANDNYFKGKPKIGSLKFKFIGESKLLVSQLKAGELDVATDVDIPQIELFKSIKGYTLLLQPTLELERLDFNTENPLFKNEKVRTAIAFAIDKKHICQNLLGGAANQTASYIAPYSGLYDAALEDKQDIQTAKTLLAADGWRAGVDGVLAKAGNRLSFGLSVNATDTIRTVIAENISANLREIGVEAVVVKVPDNKFSEIIATGNFQTVMYTMMMYPDFYGAPLWLGSQIPVAANGYRGKNFSRYSDLRIEKLLTESNAPQSFEQQKSNALLVQKYLNQAMPSIPLCYYLSADLVCKELKNFAPGVVFASDYRNSYLWQW